LRSPLSAAGDLAGNGAPTTGAPRGAVAPALHRGCAGAAAGPDRRRLTRSCCRRNWARDLGYASGWAGENRGGSRVRGLVNGGSGRRSPPIPAAYRANPSSPWPGLDTAVSRAGGERRQSVPSATRTCPAAGSGIQPSCAPDRWASKVGRPRSKVTASVGLLPCGPGLLLIIYRSRPDTMFRGPKIRPAPLTACSWATYSRALLVLGAGECQPAAAALRRDAGLRLSGHRRRTTGPSRRGRHAHPVAVAVRTGHAGARLPGRAGPAGFCAPREPGRRPVLERRD